MEEGATVMTDSKQTLSMNPKKFSLWLFIGSVIMMFGGFTSAFIVITAERATQDLTLPSSLLYSTIIIALSSASMHWALLSARKDEFGRLKAGLIVTFLLGIAFLILQLIAWGGLVSAHVHFVSNDVLGSFVYVLTGVHGLHIISALIFLMVTLVSALKLNIHSKNMTKIEMCATYWHFLGILWLYLYIFLILNIN